MAVAAGDPQRVRPGGTVPLIGLGVVIGVAGLTATHDGCFLEMPLCKHPPRPRWARCHSSPPRPDLR